MAENLNYNAASSKCYGDNNGGDSQGYCVIYGRLYDWETTKKACPTGWHLPSNEDWTILKDFVENNSKCSNCAGTKLKSITGWNSGDDGYIPGTDDYGFSALPGGIGFFALPGESFDVLFFNVGIYGYWWTATEYNSNLAYSRAMVSEREGASGSEQGKASLLSVRCIRNN